MSSVYLDVPDDLLSTMGVQALAKGVSRSEYLKMIIQCGLDADRERTTCVKLTHSEYSELIKRKDEFVPKHIQTNHPHPLAVVLATLASLVILAILGLAVSMPFMLGGHTRTAMPFVTHAITINELEITEDGGLRNVKLVYTVDGVMRTGYFRTSQYTADRIDALWRTNWKADRQKRYMLSYEGNWIKAFYPEEL